jgi:hypothetical protein
MSALEHLSLMAADLFQARFNSKAESPVYIDRAFDISYPSLGMNIRLTGSCVQAMFASVQALTKTAHSQ